MGNKKEVISEDFKSLDISISRGLSRVVHIKQGRAGIPAPGIERSTLTGEIIDSILSDRETTGADKISKIHIKSI